MNVFEYEKFCEVYEQLKTTIGKIEDIGTETIGGIINTSNTSIRNGLSYAEESAWASSKLNDWELLYPTLTKNYEDLVNLLTNAKVAADKYDEFEKKNQGF